MRVQCPNCKTIYRLDISKIPGKGAYARCRKCTHRFIIRVGSAAQSQQTKSISEERKERDRASDRHVCIKSAHRSRNVLSLVRLSKREITIAGAVCLTLLVALAIVILRHVRERAILYDSAVRPIEALGRLQARTEINISLKDYVDELGNIKLEVNSFLDCAEADRLPELVESVSNTLARYDMAKVLFEYKEAYSNCDYLHLKLVRCNDDASCVVFLKTNQPNNVGKTILGNLVTVYPDIFELKERIVVPSGEYEVITVDKAIKYMWGIAREELDRARYLLSTLL